MKLSIKLNRRQTFPQRLTRIAVFWGLPMVCLEFIGVPLFGWITVLGLVVPATLVGVLAGAAIEHLLISALAKEE